MQDPIIHIGHNVVRGAAESGTILHVPHSSWTIPSDVRQRILLGEDELAHELALMTDAHTDVIAERAVSTAAQRPWTFVNQLSRLVIDPERYDDEREMMRRVGMGAVYTHTSSGELLRNNDDEAERELLAAWFHPYAKAMTDLVDERIAATGRAIIIDVHSYPSRRLPYEIGGEGRPGICLGTEEVHTPTWLVAAGREAFAAVGDVAYDTPFAGCYVPQKHSEDERVAALMVEIRRDIYMVEPGGPSTHGLATVSRCLADLIDAIAQR